jgi:hypothetical protein
VCSHENVLVLAGSKKSSLWDMDPDALRVEERLGAGSFGEVHIHTLSLDPLTQGESRCGVVLTEVHQSPSSACNLHKRRRRPTSLSGFLARFDFFGTKVELIA